MTDSEPKLTSRDKQLAALVACGRTHREAAEALGIGTATIERAARKPEFAAEVRRLRAEMVAEVLGAAAGAARAAVAELVRLSKEGTSREGVKVRACLGLLRVVSDWAALADLRAELDRMKEMFARRDEPKPPAPIPPAAPAPSELPATEDRLTDIEAALRGEV